MKLEQKEVDIQKSIIDYLEWNKWIVVRFNNMPRYDKKTDRYFPTRKRGVADLLCCSPEGRFVAIEVKSKVGKLSDEQIQFLEQVERSGGVSVVARSINDIELLVKTM